MIYFDSRKTEYKQPFGALRSGNCLRLRVAADSSFVIHNIEVVIRYDPHPEPARYRMEKTGGAPAAENSCSCYAAELLPDACALPDRAAVTWYEAVFPVHDPGLYWYWFELDTDRGRVCLGKGRSGSRGVLGGEALLPWQLSVYRQQYEEPSWIYGGVFYHIFVDRFYHAGAKVELPDKELRADWGGCPRYTPDADGRWNSDFFGGNLRGILEKLPYLDELGVSCLYLSPIFKAFSNHKYDTADYHTIDEMFGSEEDFHALVEAAESRGIRIILDGVFAHTGSDSLYFDREGHYGGRGAWGHPDSPYRSWYRFHEDGSYDCWWGIDTLPQVSRGDPSYLEFLTGEQGVVRKWLSFGASGWRLDVVDELPAFLMREIVRAARETKRDALLLGEVWEDASSKIAYDERKNYFRGDGLDAVMNYPFREAVLRLVREGNSVFFRETVESVVENYPPFALHASMNLLGTHDSPRILTMLGAGADPASWSKEEAADKTLTKEERALAAKRLKLAVLLQMTLPGVPSVYYGDEAGLEGGADPFNRRCYPWGREDTEILSWYRRIIRIRLSHEVYRTGDYRTIAAEGGLLAFARISDMAETPFEGVGSPAQTRSFDTHTEHKKTAATMVTAVNCGSEEASFTLPGSWKDCLEGEIYKDQIRLWPGQGVLLEPSGEA